MQKDCPVREENNIKDIGIFNLDKEELKKIMEGDPGIKEGIFSYEILTCKSFPGEFSSIENFIKNQQ